MTLGYLDLVIQTVRGRSPIPEFRELNVDRSKLAKDYFDELYVKFGGRETGHSVLDMVLQGDAGVLEFLWNKTAPSSLTMCGDKSIAQLLEALRTIEAEKIPGDLIEAGVWRGGLPIIMRAFLHSVGNVDRKVWIADSFRGLPGDLEDGDDKAAHLLLAPILHLSVNRKQVEDALDFFGLRDPQVEFLEGWFKDTLPKLPAEKLALVRLDGDYFESTRDSLENLYPKLSPGGYLIVDDYNLPLGCRRAVDEYRERNGITEPLVEINSQAVYWRKAAK